MRLSAVRLKSLLLGARIVVLVPEAFNVQVEMRQQYPNVIQDHTVHKAVSLGYEKWNNIAHYNQNEINGRGPCEPSLTS